jgi:hypothetical protein
MALATLSIDIIAKLADLEQGFNKASRLAEQNAQKIEGAFAGLRTGAMALGGVVAGIFAGFSIKEFVVHTNEGVAALEDLSKATGSSVENLSALEDVGIRTGNTFDTMAATLVRFNKELTGAKAGDDVTRIFSALGLSIKELKALDPAEALRRTAVALEGFADDGDKARAVQVLFGKSIREAAPFLHDLASQTQLHGTVTAEAAKAAKDFSDQLNSLSKNSTDTARAIVGPIVEWLNLAIEKFKQARDASREWAKKGRDEEDVEDKARAIQRVNDMIAAQTKILGDSTIPLERKIRLEKQLVGLREQQAKLAGTFIDRNENFDSPGETRDRPRPKLKVAGDVVPQTEIQKLIEKYRELFDAELHVNDLDKELAKAKALLADPKFKDATDAERQIVKDYADGLDKLKESLHAVNDAHEQFRHDEIASTTAVNKAIVDQATAQMEAMSKLFRAGDPTRDTVRQEIQLRKYLEDIGASAEESAAAINALWNTNPDPTLKALSDMDMAVQDLGKSLDETLGQGLEAMLSGHFNDIGKLFQRMLEQMAVKALQADLMDKLFGAMGAGGQRGGGWINAALAMFGSRASGGVVAPWSLTQVNDQAGASGVEGFSTGGRDFMLTGSQGGRVTQAGGRAAAVVQVNIAAGVSRNEVAALIPALKAQIKAEVVASMRRPGFSGG